MTGLTALMAAVLENTTGSAAQMDCTALPLKITALLLKTFSKC